MELAGVKDLVFAPPLPGAVLRRKGGWSPLIRVVETPHGLAVEKDYSAKPLPIRATVARLFVRREREVLRHLSGLPGIPKLLPCNDPLRIRTQYIPGQSINRFKAGGLPSEVFQRLEALVESMHERRIVHLDLRQRKNVLIRDDGQPFLLDFTNAIRFRLRGGLARWVFERLVTVDRSALLKYKNRLFPGLLTEADREDLRRHQRIRRFWFLKPHKKRAKDRIQ
jgi:tRNA A-37 threonylcarbamoyl transferase component Bud32